MYMFYTYGISLCIHISKRTHTLRHQYVIINNALSSANCFLLWSIKMYIVLFMTFISLFNYLHMMSAFSLCEKGLIMCQELNAAFIHTHTHAHTYMSRYRWWVSLMQLDDYCPLVTLWHQINGVNWYLTYYLTRI